MVSERLFQRKFRDKIRLNMESLKSVGAMILTWISETLKGFEDDKGSMN
jgi:hypothetical protein